MCPHCRSVNVFPGFSCIIAFVYQSCGKGVSTQESPEIQSWQPHPPDSALQSAYQEAYDARTEATH
jgi:hypothetical protein